MSAVSNPLSEPRELGRLLVFYWRRWAIVTLLTFLAAVAYVFLAPNTWLASQALMVRSEAVGSDADSGRFRAPEELKSTQETIAELSKSRTVLKATLVEVGPPENCDRPLDWPSDKDVECLQKAVKVAPPKGVEFGTSGVFYLEVRDSDRARSTRLGSALGRQLQLHLQEIRDAKAKSMIDELSKAMLLAKSDLQTATARLTSLEKDVGSDLPELRSLLDANSSDTSLRRTVSEVENELRQVRTTENANRQLLALLKQAQADPARLIAAPSRLLESQPALRRLKEGLVDAQIRTATLQGRMSGEHPAVMSAKEAEAQVAQRLHAELSCAIAGLESELRLDANRLSMLESQRGSAAARLTRLAGVRATYMNAISESANRAKLLDRAEQNLTNARSDSASARAASLISRVDAPNTGTSPVSPSGLMIILGGTLGGLLAGFGLVLLTAPAPTTQTRSSEVPPVAAAARVESAVPCATSLSPALQPVTSLAAAREPWSMSVAAHGSLNCTQALKVLHEQGKLGNATVLQIDRKSAP
jgi:polysaccharide biosynthesis transport protein